MNLVSFSMKFLRILCIFLEFYRQYIILSFSVKAIPCSLQYSNKV